MASLIGGGLQAITYPLWYGSSDLRFGSWEVDSLERSLLFVPAGIVALLVAVQAGELATVLPGALVATVTAQSGLEARPLTDPDVTKTMALMTMSGVRPTRTLEAALRLAADRAWRADAQANSGPLERAASRQDAP